MCGQRGSCANWMRRRKCLVCAIVRFEKCHKPTFSIKLSEISNRGGVWTSLCTCDAACTFPTNFFRTFFFHNPTIIVHRSRGRCFRSYLLSLPKRAGKHYIKKWTDLRECIKLDKACSIIAACTFTNRIRLISRGAIHLADSFIENNANDYSYIKK